MSDGDDEEAEEAADETPELSPEDFESRLDDAESALEDAETEADLDGVEATLDAVESDLDAADLPEADEEDEADPAEAFADRLSALREDLESQRGPYAEDVVEAVETAAGTVADTRWTERGEPAVADAVESFVDDADGTLDADLAVDGDDEDALTAALDAVAEAVEDADLDPDEDAETVAALVAAADDLTAALEDAEEWDDLEVREQLEAEGFYDVLGHYKDFPPEWSALKAHERNGDVEMVLLALDSLDSDFMERHCMEALVRMGDPRGYDEMFQRAGRRDRPGIEALGKMGPAAEDAVDTLLEYVDTDSDPGLQKVTFKALGEIGSEEATQALADKLVMDNDTVRPYAARALGLLGDTRAVDPLVETLETDEVDTVRASAAWALRQIGTERALEAAAEATADDSFLVAHEAELAAEALDAATA
jgi:hypothetical protein